MIALRESECCALAGTDCRPLLLRRRAGRPQLKRDPLGSPNQVTGASAPVRFTMVFAMSLAVACATVSSGSGGLADPKGPTSCAGVANTDSTVYDTTQVAERPRVRSGPWLEYPAAKRQRHVQGRVLVASIIQADGTVDQSSVRVVRGVDPSLDREALRWARVRPTGLGAVMVGRCVFRSFSPLTSRSLVCNWSGLPNKRLKLAGALVLKEAVMSCPGGHGTFVHYSCAGGWVARSLSAIR